MIAAAGNGQTDVVRVLLEQGADADARAGSGLTALMGAAINDHVDAVRALLDHDADANAKQKDGWTALMFAADKGLVEPTKVLLAGGADRDVQAGGETALTRAVRAGHADVVQLFRKAGGGNTQR